MRFFFRNALLSRSWLAGSAVAAVLWLGWPLQAENITPPRVSRDRSGEMRVANGMTLHLSADLGTVRIQTLPPGAPPTFRYSIHIETDAANSVGQKLLDAYSLATRETFDSVFLTGALPNWRPNPGSHRRSEVYPQFYVQFVITVPVNFNLDVSTGIGDIETPDIFGHVTLVTQGGNITTGRVGLPMLTAPRSDHLMARLETSGGHIIVKDVAGDLDAYTAGGNIQTGSVDGNAKLRTGGGHIRAAKIRGTAQLETEGGNIAVGEAGSSVGVHTVGGQIDFGEVHGTVHALTGGGGIRAMYVSGPLEVATTGGSICLTRVANVVKAATGEGTITAWITPDALQKTQMVRLPGASQLASRSGDIKVFLPRNIAMTVDVTVDSGGPAQVDADPSLLLNMQARADGPSHGVTNLNGGGAVLRLHTVSGKIHVQYQDAQSNLRQTLVAEQQQRLAEKLNDASVIPASLSTQPAGAPPPLSASDTRQDWFDVAKNRLEVIFMGSIHEDEESFERRMTYSPPAEPPPLVRKAGLHGRVLLQVRLKSDGSVSLEKVLQGEPALADAAIAAVQKWRGTPGMVAGKKVEVVSTVTFNFPMLPPQ